MKLDKKYVEQVEAHVVHFLGRRRLRQSDKAKYKRLGQGSYGWTIGDVIKARTIEDKFPALAHIKIGSLWKTTKGDADAMIVWVRVRGDSKAVKMLRQIKKHGVEWVLEQNKKMREG